MSSRYPFGRILKFPSEQAIARNRDPFGIRHCFFPNPIRSPARSVQVSLRIDHQGVKQELLRHAHYMLGFTILLHAEHICLNMLRIRHRCILIGVHIQVPIRSNGYKRSRGFINRSDACARFGRIFTEHDPIGSPHGFGTLLHKSASLSKIPGSQVIIMMRTQAPTGQPHILKGIYRTVHAAVPSSPGR
ncbi:hypothetical protein D3C73_761720 [compost metagenome]